MEGWEDFAMRAKALTEAKKASEKAKDILRTAISDLPGVKNATKGLEAVSIDFTVDPDGKINVSWVYQVEGRRARSRSIDLSEGFEVRSQRGPVDPARDTEVPPQSGPIDPATDTELTDWLESIGIKGKEAPVVRAFMNRGKLGSKLREPALPW